MTDKLSRRVLLTGTAAALAATALTGTPARLLAATDDWRVDLAHPGIPEADRMLGIPFEKHETVRIAIVGTGCADAPSSVNVAIEGVKITALCDVVETRWRAAMVTKAGSRAGDVLSTAKRTSNASFSARHRHRLHRHAVALAHAGLPRRDEGRQARRHGSPGGDVARRVLGTGAHVGADAEALPDDGELLLRQQ
jgi:hypothetical protein